MVRPGPGCKLRGCEPVQARMRSVNEGADLDALALLGPEAVGHVRKDRDAHVAGHMLHRTAMPRSAQRADAPSKGTGLYNAVRKMPDVPACYFSRSFISVTIVIEIGPVEKPPTLKAW